MDLEKLKEITIEITPEYLENIIAKKYANGRDKKLGDRFFYGMIEDNDLNKHIVSVCIDDVGENKDYEFNGNFFQDNLFPILTSNLKKDQEFAYDLGLFNKYMESLK